MILNLKMQEICPDCWLAAVKVDLMLAFFFLIHSAIVAKFRRNLLCQLV